MRLKLILAAALFVMASTAACAWVNYLDGTALPESPWEQWATEGETTLVTAFDGSQSIQTNSWGGAHEWYWNPTQPVALAAARFSLSGFTATGSEDLLCVIADNLVGEEDGNLIFSSPSVSITLVDGHFWVYDYTAGEGFVDLGAAVANQFHTAYIMVDGAAATAKVLWDGAVVFNGPAPAHDLDGWIEWGSGSWQTDAHTFVQWDWLGYGGAADMVPEPGSLLALGVGLVGLLGAVRRRR